MNKIENSLSRKILLVVATVFVGITIISYVAITSLLKDTLYKLEQDKANLIADTYAPLISVQLFLEMKDRVGNLTNNIMKNENVLEVYIYSNNSLFLSKIKENSTDGMEVQVPIYKPNSQTKIGKLKIIYSTDNFNKLINKYLIYMIASLLIIALIFTVLNIYIKNLLKPLKKLANILKNYSPETVIDIPYLDEANEIGLISNAMDSSQKKSLEYSKQLQNYNDLLEEKVKEEVDIVKQKDKQLLYQSRLAQMGEMISMIAHQWRQPLSAISATANNLTLNLMMDDINKEEFTSEIKLITDYSQHLSSTIDDFRNFFKKNKTKEFTTLDQIVNSTLNIVQTSVENKNIEIKLDIKCEKEFETYSNEIKQVVLNLIKNAEDAVLDKGIPNPYIEIQTQCIDKSMILIVRDNAGGIPQKIMDKIFDPYFSTKKNKDGTGLGLYMSKTIIEDHCGGKLSVTNDENGACFKIEIVRD